MSGVRQLCFSSFLTFRKSPFICFTTRAGTLTLTRWSMPLLPEWRVTDTTLAKKEEARYRSTRWFRGQGTWWPWSSTNLFIARLLRDKKPSRFGVSWRIKKTKIYRTTRMILICVLITKELLIQTCLNSVFLQILKKHRIKAKVIMCRVRGLLSL